jgi:hypothetical protein
MQEEYAKLQKEPISSAYRWKFLKTLSDETETFTERPSSLTVYVDNLNLCHTWNRKSQYGGFFL